MKKDAPLAKRQCEACDEKTPPLSPERIEELSAQLKGWQVVDSKLKKEFKTKDFISSLKLANKIGEIAEQEYHHPDLLVRWGKVGVEIWTHAIDGLSENDFILAAKIDQIKK
jgi:4a-hydroxytetrahydrobiopterin dehydratase